MTRLPLLGTALALALATPAAAFDLTRMSPAERDVFRAEIREYLLDNPEVIMEAVAVLEQREQQAQALADVDLVRDNAQALFEDTHSWTGGNPDGDITLVEFLDYRCGYCRRAFPEVEELIAQDGNIRIIVKEFPILGEESELASRYAIATKQLAGDEAYKAIHDALMEYSGPINDTSLSRLGETLGLDNGAILAAMQSDAVTEVITTNRNLAQRMKISGTPSFVMNDQMLRGYLPLASMQDVARNIRTR